MASSMPTQDSAPSTLRQNWVIGPVLDFLLIVAAPVLGLLWAVATYHLVYRVSTGRYGLSPEVAVQQGITAVLSIFVIFNVAHHLPTFMRIYGDRDLVRRFRWSLLLGPVVPLAASFLLAWYVISSDLDIGFILYINLILMLWDPWHFLMQHYGFMRIYDRHNSAPRKLASWMDYGICASWFVFIMIATADWLPDILYRLHVGHGIPLLDWLPMQGLQVMQWVTLALSIAMSVVYLAYLIWCRGKGYYVSSAKVCLVLTTFAVMYVAYVPNPIIRMLVPQWTFAMGFAALGMVHVSQYLAIVWKYNRSLARRNAKERSGPFERTFGQQGGLALVVLGAYVALCLLYGFILSSTGNRLIVPFVSAGKPFIDMGLIAKWIVVFLGAVVFTSTLLHYYYDGFIWKVRHKENRQNLDMAGTTAAAQTDTETRGSWWDRQGSLSVLGTLGRQCIYFLLPIGLLTATFWSAGFERLSPLQVYQASMAANRLDSGVVSGLMTEIEYRLPIEQKLIDLRPQATYCTYYAQLLYLRATLRNRQVEPLPATNFGALLLVQEDLQGAQQKLEMALALPPPYGHREQPELSRQDVTKLLEAIRSELNQIAPFLARHP